MGGKRRTFPEKFKAKIAPEAVRGIRTLNESATDYQVHPNLISDRKKQLLTRARKFFPREKPGRRKPKRNLRLRFTKKPADLKRKSGGSKKTVGLTIPIRRQFRPAGVSGLGFYYKPVPVKEENLLLMRLTDGQYMKHPAFGCQLMPDRLRDEGYEVSRKRVARLVRRMGLKAITPPNLLRNVEIGRVNGVWGTDITCIPMRHGFMCLTAAIGWYSRFVPAWSCGGHTRQSLLGGGA